MACALLLSGALALNPQGINRGSNRLAGVYPWSPQYKLLGHITLSGPGPSPLPSSERSRHAKCHMCRVARFLRVVGMVGQEKAAVGVEWGEASGGQTPETELQRGEKEQVPQ